MGRNVVLTGLLTAIVCAARPIIAQSAYQLTKPARHGFDRVRAQGDTEAYLVKLIGIDTQNPPGNETRVAVHRRN